MATSENSSSDDSFYTSQEEVTQKKAQFDFSRDEEALMLRMFNLVGHRWSLIAGRIPGRTEYEIERYFISRFSTSGDSTNSSFYYKSFQDF